MSNLDILKNYLSKQQIRDTEKKEWLNLEVDRILIKPLHSGDKKIIVEKCFILKNPNRIEESPSSKIDNSNFRISYYENLY
jgi:hypothetical protein